MEWTKLMVLGVVIVCISVFALSIAPEDRRKKQVPHNFPDRRKAKRRWYD